jgi:hypothetical protein
MSVAELALFSCSALRKLHFSSTALPCRSVCCHDRNDKSVQRGRRLDFVEISGGAILSFASARRIALRGRTGRTEATPKRHKNGPSVLLTAE